MSLQCYWTVRYRSLLREKQAHPVHSKNPEGDIQHLGSIQHLYCFVQTFRSSYLKERALSWGDLSQSLTQWKTHPSSRLFYESNFNSRREQTARDPCEKHISNKSSSDRPSQQFHTHAAYSSMIDDWIRCITRIRTHLFSGNYLYWAHSITGQNQMKCWRTSHTKEHCWLPFTEECSITFSFFFFSLWCAHLFLYSRLISSTCFSFETRQVRPMIVTNHKSYLWATLMSISTGGVFLFGA